MRDHIERRLAAILAADVVGYSRMMAADEAATLVALRHHRRSVFDPAVANNKGRLVKLMGDGALVQFDSVVDAVTCALALQDDVAPEADNSLSAIVLRIGVNLGDVILENGDVYGDGVNIAARLESLAEPGGICISSLVKESIVGRINVLFNDGGQVQLKNIDRPIHIWKWQRPTSGNAIPKAAQAENMCPALAVLPFQNMSGELAQEYFADGVVEDIITALSRFRSFAVIARNSSFIYKDRADVRQAARELGVRYVLEGSIRKAGTRLRITAQLVEGRTGAHLWAEHYDGSAEDVFDFQDHITESVVAIVEPHIKSAEIARSRRERPGSAEAYDMYLQALENLHASEPDRNTVGLSLIQKAIEIEPSNATYLAFGVILLMQRAVLGWNFPSAADDRALCMNFIERALSTGNGDATVVATCGNALIQYLREYDRGVELVQRAVAMNPNNLDVVNVAGVANLLCGSLDEASAYFLRAERLSATGMGSHWSLTGLAHAELVRGNLEQALVWAGKSLAANQHYGPCFWMLIAANARLGRIDEARRHLASLLAISPTISVASIREGQAAKIPGRIEPILEGLLLAGMCRGE